VEGSHRFHEVFVDLCFLHKIVRAGGLVVIDDDWWPSMHTAVQDYEQNTGWKVIPDAFAGETIGVGPHGEEGGNKSTGRRRSQTPKSSR
jgi:hypothetical protein